MIYLFVFILSCGFLLVLHMWLEAHRISVEKKDIHLEHFPESFNGLKVFFISDIHTRTLDEQLIDKIDEHIDLVIIGGDLVERKVLFDRVSKNIDVLNKLAPIYFVWGNNDYEVDYRKLDVLLRDKGVTVLDNTCAQLEKDGESLLLLGVDDATLDRDSLPLTLQDANQTGFRILISHNPIITNQIEENHDIGLVLAGHTHGGQIRFFKWGIAEQGGLKSCDYTKLFISNGYGYTQLPLRLCAPAQTHILTIYNS
ncbi:metallophosphoesterase [Pseudalkalibacillus berkeleyi]|uniref:Metallophosphoesterase n=1 Tax=Pseudalkalibacillus berkeleyi TaxID=1069813 RepID=A0ABS9GY50_9BACL|nr:metallophosphoesterase [Pseudalkalibacillus berkeleyi]MCF6137604.1 metallophosphoesterase [Pseudalkalibacillus berkeleyi]